MGSEPEDMRLWDVGVSFGQKWEDILVF